MKKKTKILAMVVLAMIVLLLSAVSANAQEADLPECEQHSYEDVIVPATVNADGYTLRRCSVCMAEKDKAIIRQIGGVSFF